MRSVSWLSRRVLAGSLLALATVALASTWQELEAQADALHSGCVALSADVLACSDGQCEQRASLEDRFASAEATLVELEEARSALGACPSCAALDATLADVRELESAMRAVMTEWDDQS